MRDIIITIDNNFDLKTAIDVKKYLQQYVKPGDELKCKLTKSRNIKHNSKYWVLLNALEFHFDNTAEAWHMFFKSRFLPMVEFAFKTGKRVLYPASTAFDKMSQLEFDEYYKKVEKFLNDYGYDIDEIINTMEV